MRTRAADRPLRIPATDCDFHRSLESPPSRSNRIHRAFLIFDRARENISRRVVRGFR